MTINQGANSPGSATLNSSDRLRKIDLLREKNIGAHLPLPQLVAVGDQSSGKSSLLESLTGIPFPRDQNLCTRYATQITHRREDIAHINISIIPGPHASDEDKARLSGYAREVQSTAELHAEFSVILDEVNKLVGIRTASNPSGNKTFTEDVLKIEKCGPEEDYLTIIDVPGIFRVVEEGMVSTTDRKLVRDMVDKYIRDSRTVILAVLPSTSDVFTQEILELAEEHDKKGERTLGILTKPDLLKENRAKSSICDMVNGKRKSLNLGYYLVRNKGADDGNDLDWLGVLLAERERIFQEEPWSSLPKDRVGIKALRERLQDLLGHITDKCFPLVRMETRQMLVECQKARDELGEPRQSEREQQKYLATIAGKFQALARTGLDADYYIDPAFTNGDFRLITSVINITECFGRGFMRESSVYSFQKEGTEPAPAPPKATATMAHAFTALDINDLEDEGFDEFPELDGILATDWSFHPPKDGLIPWIDSMYCRSRGIDLFTYSSSLPASAFREQSAKWRSMTEQYLSKVIFVLHRFIMGVLDLVCKDKQVFEQVKSSIMEDLLARYREGTDQAMFLVSVEREKKPYTLNQNFYDLVDASRYQRSSNAAGLMACRNAGPSVVQHRPSPSKTGLPPAAEENKDNKERIKEDIYDKLKAYYEVASKRFLDNVFRQAVDHCLLSGPRSPLLVFSEQWVIGLSKEKLAGIAGEPRASRERRENLDKKIVDLEGAIRILQ